MFTASGYNDQPLVHPSQRLLAIPVGRVRSLAMILGNMQGFPVSEIFQQLRHLRGKGIFLALVGIRSIPESFPECFSALLQLPILK